MVKRNGFDRNGRGVCMTETPNHLDLPVPPDEDEPPLTPAEIEEFRRE